ncbi:MAG: M36 family metallopeptidase [Spirosomataceae bacterium]
MNLKFTTTTFLFLFVSICYFSFAQDPNLEAAKLHLKSKQEKLSLSNNDLAEMQLSSAYISPSTGWYHAYFTQTHQAIEVYNGILNVALKDGHLIHTGNSFLPNIEQRLSSVSAKPSVSAQSALIKTAERIGISSNKLNDITLKNSVNNVKGETTKYVFNAKSISAEPIDVKLYWFPHEILVENKQVQTISLVWDVSFLSNDKQNAWEAHVDAATGAIISVRDNVIKCEFGHRHTDPSKIEACNQLVNIKAEEKQSKALLANSYTVFNYPLESPIYGSRSVVTNPYTNFVPSGTGPGSTNGWHDDGTSTFTDTRGNNVYAQDDTNADDTGGNRPNPSNYEFDYPYTLGLNTAAANQNAAITNLFFWNNLIHDVLWKMGFDEPSGNFQKSNMNRGGSGNDFVYADAQDGSGSNNANFYTPIDGSNPRMQMFLWNYPSTYLADSDFDNAIIAHEYGHGWSIRLTGGPNNVSCLWNAEQGGEGWSDYLGLMLTTNWGNLTPTVSSANIPRGIGTYVLGQLTTGLGIRPYQYSYNMATVNPIVTYAAVGNTSFSQPHGIGSIWCTMLWDMTWEIILQDNAIEPNIYNTNNMIGNIAALKLVNEGLRLQPCSPSFVQARDAILAADQALFGGRYRCAIGRAFARRGLGKNASTGTSTNDRVVTEDFTVLDGNALSSSLENNVCSGSTFNYTATSNTAGTTFRWVRSQVAGISNPTSSGNSAQINETLINTTTNAVTVYYNFYFTPSGCGLTGEVMQSVKLTVYPVPIQPTVANYSICQNGSVPNGQGLRMPSTTYVTNISSALTTSDPTFSPLGSTGSFYYKVYPFVPQNSGVVSLEITAGSYDTYLYLYSNSFNPNSPYTNLLTYDDDSGIGTLSLISYNLTAGTQYYVVVSSYNSLTTGTYTLNSSVLGFGTSYAWFTTPTGGTSIYTGSVFNPIGVAGSGITNSISPISKNYYVASLENTNCRALTNFTINQATVEPTLSGSVMGSDTVCAIFNGGILNLNNHTGTVIGWEKSEDNFRTWTTLQSNNSNYIYNSLLKTTQIRAILSRGSCQIARSSIATIDVIAPVQTLIDTINVDTTFNRASLSIVSSQKIFDPSKVHYQAGRKIELTSGFETKAGTNFKAEIINNDCYIPVTLTLQPDSSNSNDIDISSLFPTTTFTTNRYLVPYNWSQFGNTETRRTLIKFDLSSIPANAVIDSAYLSLYYSQKFVNDNPPFTGHFGTNAFEVKRITQDWIAATTNWSNQPVTTNTNQVIGATSTSSTQNYLNLNVKNLVIEQKQNGNYGFLIKHQTETPYKITCLTSSEEQNATLRPKLVVYYRYQ